MATLANYPNTRPAYMLDFVGSAGVDPRIAFTRSSNATRRNAAGVLEVVPADVPRTDYDPTTGRCLGLHVEGSKTNMAPRNMSTGAVLGVIGSGGSLPTGWSTTPKSTSGLDVEVAGVGSENGLPYVDVRVFGAPISGYQAIIFGNVTGYAVSTEYSGSVFAKMLSGFAGGAGSMQLQARYNVAGGSVNITGGYTPADLGGDLRAQRLIANGVTDVAAAGAGQFLLVFNLTNGVAYDFKVRLAVPQLETGTASSVIFTDGAAATRAADAPVLDLPSYTDITVLVEFAHGNKLRATRAVGLYKSPEGSPSISVIASNSSNTASAGAIATNGGPNQAIPMPSIAGRIDRVAFTRDSGGRVLLASRGGALSGGVMTAGALMQTLALGNSSSAGANSLDGYVRRVSIWLRTMTQAELNRLTEVAA